MEVGIRVVRGPDWKWADQDGGEGTVGTVIQAGSNTCRESPDGTVVVYWDIGHQTNYRIGYNKSFDLRLFDNATIGVHHVDIICNECKKQGIAGLRFKCLECVNYDLCQLCYMADRHDVEHRFQRFDFHGSPGIDLPPRKGCTKKTLRGTFVGAKVKRGKDWEWGDQDGLRGKFGRVLEVNGWNNETWRSVVKVIWWMGHTNIYRVGYKGKVDLECVEPASPGTYYPSHLPVLGKTHSEPLTPTDFKYYERVKIPIDAENLKIMQKGHNGWNELMAEAIGLTGRVHRVTDKGDVRVWYPQQQLKWTLNPKALIKVTESFDKGDLVTILRDKNVVSRLQKNGHGDWIDKMDSILGKTGQVVKTYQDGDLRVTVEGQTWTLNPLCVDLLKNGDRISNTDLISAVTADIENLDLTTSSKLHRIVLDAGQGLLENIEEYFAQNPDKINLKSHNKTCLQVASHQGQMAVVKKLLELGADISIQDEVGDTALHYAAFGNHSGILDILLGAGADVNSSNNNNKCTALHICVSKRHIACIKVILKYQPNVNLQDVFGDTPLHDAIANEFSEAIELLTEYPGINLDVRNLRGFNTLHHSTIKGNSFATECILLAARHLVDVKKDDGFTALHLAALNGHKNVVEVLIMSGKAQIDLVNNKQQTALMLSVSQGHCSTTELLVHCGASVLAIDEDGDTALHMVLIKSSYITSEVKKDRNPRLDQSSPNIFRIYTDLEFGEENKDRLISLSIACYLVEEGSDIKILNKKGKSPLDLVSRPGDADILQTFVVTESERSRRREAKGPVECLVCSELCDAKVTLEPCGHKIACEDCSSRLKKCFKCHVFVTKRLTHDGRSIEYKSKQQPSAECLRYLETKIAEIEEVHCCTICMERRKNVVFLCGHSACDRCSAELTTCHMCRTTIIRKINIY